VGYLFVGIAGGWEIVESMNFSYTINELWSLLRPQRIAGGGAVVVSRVRSLAGAGQGDISFLGNPKYRRNVETSEASVILLPADCNIFPKDGQCFLFFDNPSMALGVLCRDIERRCRPQPSPGIHGTAIIGNGASIGARVSIGANVVIGEGASIGDGVVIMAGCYVGNRVKIGEDSTLHPSVNVMDFCEIGARVSLFSGVVVGSDGFGYETVGGVHEHIPQIGNVVICDDVDIGANSTIDRARFEHTIIGRGTKIDNLVQIGHNVIIGEGCIIVAQTGISGSTVIGNHVIIGGQVGIVGHITIPDGVMIAGKSSVAGYKEKYGKFLRGNPAMPIDEANRFYVFRKKIPELFDRVSALERILHCE
jgi:UDP-3-O-[3-hydroxymyristoyl] glucosamine N-acyltransferase